MTRALLVLTCLLALAVAGCGNKERVTTFGDTEGIWLDVGPLDYHVQGSRQLNPNQVPDDRYLTGLPKGYAQPTGKETWFAVFVTIENRTGHPAPTATDFSIVDTAGDVYKPVALDTKANPFAYLPQTLGSGETMPHPDSMQALDSTDGSMLLFKLPLTGYQNRPLELHVKSPTGAKPAEAKLDLDV
jgi:hypothetical protein